MTAKSELLEEIQLILDENGDIPPRTSNRLILAALRENYSEIKRLREDINALKIRASIWGASSGLMTSLGAILLAVLLKLL